MRNGLLITMAISIVLLFTLFVRSCSSACNRECGFVTNKGPDAKGVLWVTLDDAHAYEASQHDYDEAKIGEKWCFYY